MRTASLELTGTPQCLRRLLCTFASKSRASLFAVLAILASSIVTPQTTAGSSTPAYYSLRFHGNGSSAPDLDRVKIPVDDPSNTLPGPPVDVGATDFTIEFWMKASASENSAAAVSCGANVNWIYGNIVFDRDRYNQDRKFGISIAGGKIAFGVSGDGTGDRTICGTSTVLDAQWHHIAVQRRRSDGFMWVYVDGLLEAQADGPDGDVSYPDDGVPGSYCGGPCTNSDPYLVIGAEKHDAGPSYPSYSGWLDEIRVSTILRYSGNFTRPSAPFTTDASTAALYHLDEGTGTTVYDSSGAPGGPSNGVVRYGGSPPGPEWSTATPFSTSNSVCWPRPANPASTQYFAEGATKDDLFETWIVVANPTTATADACLTFVQAGSSQSGPRISVPPGTRKSIKVDSYVNTFEVATIVESIGGRLLAERALYSRAPGLEGAHLSKGAESPAREWFVAEGATAGGFETWILVANPNPSSAAVLEVSYLTSAGTVSLPYAPTLGPLRRMSIRVDDTVDTYHVSTRVSATGAPVVVERATYSTAPSRRGATAAPGAATTATEHVFAEGATDGPFETWILVANPEVTQDASVMVEFFDEFGTSRTVSHLVPRGSRWTVRADDYLTSYHVSTRVTSSGAAVAAERAMYRSGTPTGLGAAAGEPSQVAEKWLAVEGATVGDFETWVLVANPHRSQSADVKVSFLTAHGRASGPTLRLGPRSRSSIRVDDFVPDSYDVSTEVTVITGPSVSVERSIYSPGWLTGDSTAGPAIALA